MADSLIDDNQSSDERTALLAKWKDKSAEEVLKAKVESDLYIKTLTARFDDLTKDHLRLREEHQASTDLKTLIDQMKAKPNPDTSTNTQVEVNQTLKPEDIETLVNKKVTEKLTQHQNALRQEENLRNIQNKLKEQFGNDYQSAYKQRLDSLGLTPEYADDLAKNYPTVFLKTFELESSKPITNNSPVRSTIRNTSFAPSTMKRDWNYYQEMKKANPKLYLDPKIAIQMHNDAIELGDAFGLPD